MGLNQSSRDDLESLGYTLVDLLDIRILMDFIAPIYRQLKDKVKTAMKMKTTLTQHLKNNNCYHEIIQFIEYSRQLKYDETPDFDYLRGLLHQLK